MVFIKRLRIVSNNNELEFKNFGKIGTTPVLNYVYTISEIKKGMVLPIPQDQLDKMIKNKIAKQI